MRYEEIKDYENRKFKRLTGVKKIKSDSPIVWFSNSLFRIESDQALTSTHKTFASLYPITWSNLPFTSIRNGP